MTRLRLALVSLVTWAVLAGPATARDRLSAEDQALLDWLAGVGLPLAPEAPWVHATTGQLEWRTGDAFRDEGDEPRPPRPPEVIAGFLLSDGPEAFTVLPRNLLPRRIDRVPHTGYRPNSEVWRGAHTGKDAPVGWARADFVADMRELLEQAAHGTLRPSGGFLEAFEEHLGLRGELLALAWHAAARGHLDVAQDLIAAANGQKPWKEGSEGTPLALARAETETCVFGRIIVDFSDLRIPRSALRDRLALFTGAYPGGEHGERATGLLAVVEAMAKEDLARAQDTRPLEQLSRDEQIRRLVFDLRDQNGGQFMQPGGPSIWNDDRDRESPAERLVALGFDACPALTAALEDERPTRTVGFWRNFHFSHYMVTVGEAALEVLGRIAGRGFEPSEDTDGWTKARLMAARKREVDAWWKEWLAQGEGAALEAEFRRGRETASAVLRRLRERFPERVAAAVLAVVPSLRDPGERMHVLQGLGGLEDPGVVALLMSEVREGPDLACRVTAAFALGHGRAPELTPHMLREWQEVLRDPPWSSFNLAWGVRSLLHYLAGWAGVEGTTALESALPGLSTEIRYVVLEALPSSAASLDPTARTALKRLLVAALRDDFDTGISGSRGDVTFEHLRICDAAAQRLAQLADERATFDLGATESERNAQIVRLIAIWHARLGLPVPPASGPARAPSGAPPSLAATMVSEVEAVGLSEEHAASLASMSQRTPAPSEVIGLLQAVAASRAVPRVSARLVLQRDAGNALRLRVELRPLHGSITGAACWTIHAGTRGVREAPSGMRSVLREPLEAATWTQLEALVSAAQDAGDARPRVVEIELSRHPCDR